MFKPGDVAVNGALTVSDFYTFFAIKTPDIFNKTFIFNDKITQGTLQRYMNVVKDKGTMLDHSFVTTDIENIYYLAKSHLLGWLLTNHHVHIRQFIMVDMGNQHRLMRIDNSVEWRLIKTDSLDMNYVSPLLWLSRMPGYSELWRTVIHRRAINFHKLLSYAKFIQDMPNDLFLGFYKLLLDNHLKLSHNKSEHENRSLLPEIDHNLTVEEYKSLLLTRKNNLYHDYNKFFEGIKSLSSKYYKQPTFGEVDYQLVVNEIISSLDKELDYEESIEASLQEISSIKKEQTKIDINFSLDAFNILNEFLCKEIECIDQYVKNSLVMLEDLKKATKNKNEIKAINNVYDYIKNNKNIDRSSYFRMNELKRAAMQVFK